MLFLWGMRVYCWIANLCFIFGTTCTLVVGLLLAALFTSDEWHGCDVTRQQLIDVVFSPVLLLLFMPACVLCFMSDRPWWISATKDTSHGA